MHSTSSALRIFSELSPRVQIEVSTNVISEAYRQIEPRDKKQIDECVESIKIQCPDERLGDAAALELLAKLGMFLQSMG